MSANNIGEDEDSNSNNVLICFEQQFRQLLLESKANEVDTYIKQLFIIICIFIVANMLYSLIYILLCMQKYN